MTRENVIQFKKVLSQINGLYKEIGLLSKKNPNDAVNKFKLTFINQTIKESNDLLGQEFKPYANFDIFGDDTTPTTSDVVMILEQYIAALSRLRANNIKSKKIESDWGVDTYQTFWVVDGKISDIIE